MLRIVEHLIGEPGLDDCAAAHDDQPMRQQARDPEIVGHDDDREPELVAQSAQQIEQTGLYRDVEGRRSVRP